MKQDLPDEFDNWLKDRTDSYLLYPSDRVWKNIHKGLHPNRTGMYMSLLILVLIATSILAIREKEERASAAVSTPTPEVYAFIKKDPLRHAFSRPGQALDADRTKKNFSIAGTVSATSNRIPLETIDRHSNVSANVGANVDANINAPVVPFATEKINPLKKYALTMVGPDATIATAAAQSDDHKTVLSNVLENVLDKAKQFRKKASFQFYATPTIGYRTLNGKASNANFQYSQIFLSNNALFARDVNDAVNHSPGMGIEIGTALLYPLTKRLSFKAGLQANYTQYKIRAFSSIPEVANYGMNNYSYGSSPISTVSFYRNTGNYSNATLRNEHYMIAVPLGFDYRVAGHKKINLTVGSTIQPTYVFAQYAYLISTNLKNYAKEPTLNRRWNINSAVEASLNITDGDYQWSIAPQYRYQLMSSFKDRYPIKENLTDVGIKLGVIKTIR